MYVRLSDADQSNRTTALPIRRSISEGRTFFGVLEEEVDGGGWEGGGRGGGRRL